MRRKLIQCWRYEREECCDGESKVDWTYEEACGGEELMHACKEPYDGRRTGERRRREGMFRELVM